MTNKKAILFLVLIIILSGCSINGEIAELGDTVTVNYVGRLEDGRVFDTSIKEVAENPVILKTDSFVPRRTYTPFKLQVGLGSVISGFDEAILGMKVGEKKEISIPPEKAYGAIEDDFIEFRPRTFIIDVVESVPKNDFISETGLTDFEVNQSIPWREWKARIMAITSDSVVLKNEVSDVIMNTEIGTIEIKVNTGTITQTFTPNPDVIISTEAGSARLTLFNDTHFMVDYNHPLAGRTLTFDITLVSIEKATS